MGSGEQPATGSDGPALRPPPGAPAQQTEPVLRPPGSRSQAAADTPAAHRWLWIALLGAVLLSLMVVFVLPQLVSETGAPLPADRPVVATVPAPAPAEGRESETAREQAESTLQRFLRLRAELELANAGAWGEPLWTQAADEAAAGDRLFGERRFSDAAQRYGSALGQLEDLQAGREQRLADALDAAHRALEDNDGETAARQFELALAIEPGHEQATSGLARARVRADVVRQMDAGAAAETGGDLAAARAAYQEASTLDAEYQPASDALQRVSQQLADLAFLDAMSRALGALDAGRLADAARSLEEAARLKPEDGALRDARQRLAGARQQARLSGLRRQAADKVRSEDWQTAVDLYRKALAVDPNAGFAREGLAQARDRVRLHQQFDHYLADPSRLYSPDPLANAEKLLSTAGDAPAGEPRLAEKIARLRNHVAGARTPLPVTLRSDGQTEVVVYRVGRLGQFLDHQLQLRPGTYTVVGSRPGYRDVRRVITVQPGSPPPAVEIRCEEPI